MIVRAILAALLLTAAAHADGHFERTLSAGSSPDLYVATGSGHVHVYPGSGNEIHVTAHLKAGWNMGGGDAEERIRRIVANPPIEQSGNTIHVGDKVSDRSLYNNISIDYDITAPRGVALNLRSGSGDLEIDNLGRYLKADTGSGSVRAHQIAGSAELHTGSGDIELQQTAPGEVKATTGSGSIRVNGFNGSLQMRTGSGDIEANGALNGEASLQSGSGSIRLHLGHEAHFNLEASTGSGSIRVPALGSNQPEDRHHLGGPVNGGGPSLAARTGSGDIEIN